MTIRDRVQKMPSASLAVSDIISLVQGGSHTMSTAHSVTLQQQLPNAELVIYPDSNHGSIYQYPERFVAHAEQFLA